MDADFVIVGLPSSGKTTFLAALWHLVESEEDEECRLKLEAYEGDLVYLNQIAEAWRNFEEVPRTSQVGDVDVTMRLVDQVTGVKATASFPDLDGETFNAQIDDRRCRRKFLDDVVADDGLLLFVSSNVKGNGLSVVELNKMLPADIESEQAQDGNADDQLGSTDDDEPSVAEKTAAESGATGYAEWEPKLVPPQVRIVQLLSDLLRGPFEPRQRRLAVIISAWDLTRGMTLSPREWLAVQMPLVDQFLRTNGASFVNEVYGVSAQGVDLNDHAAVDQATTLQASHRILIVGPEGEGHDLTAPLVWLMARE